MKERDKDRVQEVKPPLREVSGSRGQVKTLEPWNPRTLKPYRESREIALLILAVLLVMVYLLKGGPIHPQDQPLQAYPQGHPVYVEIADEKGEMVYTFEGESSNPTLGKGGVGGLGEVSLKEAIKKAGIKKEGSHDGKVKTGAKVTIKPPPLPSPLEGEGEGGGIEIGTMDGEKHLVLGIPLDINRATAMDFEALPAIGPKLAERIVETRTQLGGFKSIDDLKQVKGIGEGKLEKIRRYIE